MKTNLENYEERFVDYMEGQLSADEMREVEAFVAQHPELEEDFKLFCSTKLEPDTSVVYTKKESQIKTFILNGKPTKRRRGIGLGILLDEELLKQQIQKKWRVKADTITGITIEGKTISITTK